MKIYWSIVLIRNWSDQSQKDPKLSCDQLSYSLSPDRIGRLLEPAVFVRIKCFTSVGPGNTNMDTTTQNSDHESSNKLESSEKDIDLKVEMDKVKAWAIKNPIPTGKSSFRAVHILHEY